jgi:hypothetical protein
MTIDELLGRLDRVRKTKDGWIARCPAHEDRTPSLSIARGEGRQILLRCFAGCLLDDILGRLALKVADLFPEAADTASGIRPASAVGAVADWLARARRLPPAEIRRLFACEALHGFSVVFRYRDQAGHALYDKFRALDGKRFWRRPKGAKSALYGLETLVDCDGERVIVTEGELDAHALRSAGFSPVLSVPDGTGSSLTDELLAPLAPFRDVIIATDADPPGDAFAAKLGRALGAARCVRVRFATDAGGKDANDCLIAGWSADDFDRAVADGTPIDPGADVVTDEIAPSQDETDEGSNLSKRYQVVDGRICHIRADRNGNEVVEALANFDARIEEQVSRDDGLEVTRDYLLSGRLVTGEELPRAAVGARDYGGLGWVSGAWGAEAVVAAGTGTKDHLRAAIQVLSSPTKRTIYRHTGWRKVGGRWLFLYQGGAVGASGGIEVDLDPPLDRFVLPPAVEDLRDAVLWSLRLLECGPSEVMLPLVASIYLAPLASILEPDFTLWVFGLTGSLKSEIATLAERHFGANFSRKSLPCSWTSTDNAIEYRLAMLKDVLVVIDDFAPQADARAEADQIRKSQRILRNIGNRAARGRMRPDLTGRPDRPPRGLPLVTGELLPVGASILARLVQVEVDRDRLNLPAVTAMQENGGRLVHAMRGFLEWLAPQYEELQTALPAAREEMRRDLHMRTGHLRQPEAMANLYVGLDLFCQFAESVGALDAARAQQLRDEAIRTFESFAARVRRQLVEIDPAERFVEVLNLLIVQGKVRLLDKLGDRPPRVDDAEVIGWSHGDRVLLLAGAAYRRVAIFFRDLGEHWNPGSRELYQALRKKEYVIPTDSERPDAQWRVGPDGQRVRGWPLAPGILPAVTKNVTSESPEIPGLG